MGHAGRLLQEPSSFSERNALSASAPAPAWMSSPVVPHLYDVPRQQQHPQKLEGVLPQSPPLQSPGTIIGHMLTPRSQTAHGATCSGLAMSRLFSCFVCKKHFETAVELRMHMGSHASGRPSAQSTPSLLPQCITLPVDLHRGPSPLTAQDMRSNSVIHRHNWALK